MGETNLGPAATGLKNIGGAGTDEKKVEEIRPRHAPDSQRKEVTKIVPPDQPSMEWGVKN